MINRLVVCLLYRVNVYAMSFKMFGWKKYAVEYYK